MSYEGEYRCLIRVSGGGVLRGRVRVSYERESSGVL